MIQILPLSKYLIASGLVFGVLTSSVLGHSSLESLFDLNPTVARSEYGFI